MKLYYYKDPRGNFGDDLNLWLWSQLFPEIVNGPADELFVGIGTLINHRLPKSITKHVFGSGYGYGEMPDRNDKFIFHGVRGPRTADVLGLDRSLAITDSAILIRRARIPVSDVLRKKTGFMPHAHSSFLYDWSSVCAEMELHYIDARWPVDRVLKEILGCEMILCEAMHGAIVADALRVPWIPIRCYDYIDEFKWQDWTESLRLEYKPFRIESLYDCERHYGLRRRLKDKAKRFMRSSGVWHKGWSPPPSPRTGNAEFKRAIAGLSVAKEGAPLLSEYSVTEALTAQYMDLLVKLRQDVQRSN